MGRQWGTAQQPGLMGRGPAVEPRMDTGKPDSPVAQATVAEQVRNLKMTGWAPNATIS